MATWTPFARRVSRLPTVLQLLPIRLIHVGPNIVYQGPPDQNGRILDPDGQFKPPPWDHLWRTFAAPIPLGPNQVFGGSLGTAWAHICISNTPYGTPFGRQTRPLDPLRTLKKSIRTKRKLLISRTCHHNLTPHELLQIQDPPNGPQGTCSTLPRVPQEP